MTLLNSNFEIDIGGKSRAQACVARLQELNPSCAVTAQNEMTEALVGRLDTDKETFIYVVGKTIFDLILKVLG